MPPTRPAPPGAKDSPAAAPPAPRVPRTLPLAREAFLGAVRRDTPGTDLARYAAVLDALVVWSAGHPGALEFRAGESRQNVVSFARGGSRAVFWSAQVTRGVGPRLEVHAPGGRQFTPEERARVLETLNAHSRTVLVEGDRLRIGFGALKNGAALGAVLALMEQLLAADGRPAESSP